MCRVTINEQTFNATFISRDIYRDPIQQGGFVATGRNATDAITFRFEQDMLFLSQQNSLTVSSTGNITNFTNRHPERLIINDNDHTVVTFIFKL